LHPAPLRQHHLPALDIHPPAPFSAAPRVGFQFS
jgi:hypothetical protein